MSQEKVYKIESSYKFDSYLMHLIQEVTKRSPAEILAFFHELASQIAEIGVKKKTGTGIKKNLTDYFPGTSIPFNILVKGRPYYHYQDKLDVFKCYIEVGFPDQPTYMNEEDLKNLSVLLMEKALLGGDDVVVPDFKKPEIRTPKMYKVLMDAFAGRPAPESKRKKRNNDGEI